MNDFVKNPFIQQDDSSQSLVVSTELARQETETQSALVIAKRFPRDEVEATDKILLSCSRPNLAANALYRYPRGGQIITGVTIRFAETLAQRWGNFHYGMRELSSENNASTIESYAWDLETNTKQVRLFTVPHSRYSTSGGKTELRDPRDIYETAANYGSRRVRACILGLLPIDLINAAQKQCELTQEKTLCADKDQIEGLISGFDGLGVEKASLEKFLSHRIDKVTGAEIIILRQVFVAIRDGMSKTSDFFKDVGTSDTADTILSRSNAADDADDADDDEGNKTEWPEIDELGNEVDKRGIPWHGDFHSVGRTLTQANRWRFKKGFDTVSFADYCDEYLARVADLARVAKAGNPAGDPEAKPNSELSPPWDDEDQQTGQAPEYGKDLPLSFETLRGRILDAKSTPEIDEVREMIQSSGLSTEQISELMGFAGNHYADWFEVERQEKEDDAQGQQ